MFLFITSVGLSVTMGLMGFVNLAHGAFAMAGGYLVVTLTRTLGIDFVPSLVIAAVLVGAASVVFERVLYRRLYKSTDLEQVLLTIVVAVGGLGSLKGTLLAALVLGVFDTAGKYLLADAGGFFVYAVTVVVLLIKPAGFYGRE